MEAVPFGVTWLINTLASTWLGREAAEWPTWALAKKLVCALNGAACRFLCFCRDTAVSFFPSEKCQWRALENSEQVEARIKVTYWLGDRTPSEGDLDESKMDRVILVQQIPVYMSPSPTSSIPLLSLKSFGVTILLAQALSSHPHPSAPLHIPQGSPNGFSLVFLVLLSLLSLMVLSVFFEGLIFID